jgi:hypothetical protein
MGLSNTLMSAPRALVRSMRWIPSNIERVARSHSATTRISPVPRSAAGAFDLWFWLFVPRRADALRPHMRSVRFNRRLPREAFSPAQVHHARQPITIHTIRVKVSIGESCTRL